MKKILFFLMLTIALASCKGDDGPMGPQGVPGGNGNNGQDGKDGTGTHWHSQAFMIKESDWVFEGDGPNAMNSHYFAKVKMPALTQSIFDKGTVLGYFTTAQNVKVGLPYVSLQGTGVDYTWTQTVDFEFTPGEIFFYVTYSDFLTEENWPGDMTFNVVLIWEK